MLLHRPQQPGLADAGLPGQEHQPTAPLDRPRSAAPRAGQDLVPAVHRTGALVVHVVVRPTDIGARDLPASSGKRPMTVAVRFPESVLHGTEVKEPRWQGTSTGTRSPQVCPTRPPAAATTTSWSSAPGAPGRRPPCCWPGPATTSCMVDRSLPERHQLDALAVPRRRRPAAAVGAARRRGRRAGAPESGRCCSTTATSRPARRQGPGRGRLRGRAAALRPRRGAGRRGRGAPAPRLRHRHHGDRRAASTPTGGSSG